MSLLEPVAAFAYKRRRVLLVVFVLLFGAAAAYGRGVAGTLVGGGFDDPSSESARANAALEKSFGLGTPDVVVAYTHPSARHTDPSYREALEPLLKRLKASPAVHRVGNPYGTPPDALISKDGRTVISTIKLAGDDHDTQRNFDAVQPLLEVPGLEVLVGGTVAAARQAQHAAESDLQRAELITLPLVAILLVVFFRGLVVASLPLLVGGFSVVTALAGVRILTHFTDVSIFALNIVTFVGLGVAIDYSLFMATRFRDELDAGVPIDRAVRHTLMTAGRTIGYSGAAVAVSLLAMTAFRLMLLRSVAIAGSLVVLMSLLGTLVFLPALLAALGPRIEWLRIGRKKGAHEVSRFWHRVATAVMKAPGTVTIAVTAFLVVLGLPFLHIKPSVSGASVLPEEAEARLVAELLESDRFPAHTSGPVEIFATSTSGDVLTEPSLVALGKYADEVAKVPHVARVDSVTGGTGKHTPAQVLGGLSDRTLGPVIRERLKQAVHGRDTALRVTLDVAPTSPEATLALREIRSLRVPGIDALSTSPAARLIDLQHSLGERMPYALGIICLSTFVVLFLAFGSVVMPIKAILMNILSLTASFGALVFIFQEGRFESL
ncbi:MAG: MMPL family transporter, partial [Polyangiales bacterium]